MKDSRLKRCLDLGGEILDFSDGFKKLALGSNKRLEKLLFKRLNALLRDIRKKKEML